MGVDAVSMIATGEVQLGHQHALGQWARADGALIRGACIVHAVSCLTTISAAWRPPRGSPTPARRAGASCSLQELHR